MNTYCQFGRLLPLGLAKEFGGRVQLKALDVTRSTVRSDERTVRRTHKAGDPAPRRKESIVGSLTAGLLGLLAEGTRQGQCGRQFVFMGIAHNGKSKSASCSDGIRFYHMQWQRQEKEHILFRQQMSLSHTKVYKQKSKSKSKSKSKNRNASCSDGKWFSDGRAQLVIVNNFIISTKPEAYFDNSVC
jgi:hypothetical protein